jgi:hypothetical protein
MSQKGRHGRDAPFLMNWVLWGIIRHDRPLERSAGAFDLLEGKTFHDKATKGHHIFSAFTS